MFSSLNAVSDGDCTYRNLIRLVTAQEHGLNIINPSRSWFANIERTMYKGSPGIFVRYDTATMRKSPCAFVSFGVLQGCNIIEERNVKEGLFLTKDLYLSPIAVEFTRQYCWFAQLMHLSTIGIRVFYNGMMMSTRNICTD